MACTLGAFQVDIWEPELSTLMGVPLDGKHDVTELWYHPLMLLS